MLLQLNNLILIDFVEQATYEWQRIEKLVSAQIFHESKRMEDDSKPTGLSTQ